ncbi:MAG: hypothetical protein A4S09_06715 [Proteobacteria bacterium SG_bin7]|nr:MAG: hypothetical protein A4S09_06715 [Proteobacteria bacterium SG_bin7]
MNGLAALFFFSVLQMTFVATAMTGGNHGLDENLLSIMAYNTENTFDVKHDEGKDDYTFLPLSFPDKARHCYTSPIQYREFCLKTDWTEDKAELKIHQLKRMISSQGYLPDLVALEEVENQIVMHDLAQDLGYEKFLITNSPDMRGIDVALMYNEQKLIYMSHEEINIDDGKLEKLKTRNILRVNFRVKGKQKVVLGVYVNHWPSQLKTKDTRILAAETLLADIKAQQKKYTKKHYYAVVVGDLNTTDRESTDVIGKVLGATFEDVQSFGQKNSELEGTYFYPARWRWERLDRILVSKNLVGKGELEVIPESFTVVKPSFSVHDYTEQKPKSPHYGKTMRNVPIRYDFSSTDPNTAGFSDHFPVLVNIQL